jgi:hypothetical protein
MKKLIFILYISLFVSILSAEDTKEGFLTSKWCAENSIFSDCPLESVVCGYPDCYKEWDFSQKQLSELVLYVHGESKYYSIKLAGLKRYKLDVAINIDKVKIIGDIVGDIIFAQRVEVPSQSKNGFFKECL